MRIKEEESSPILFAYGEEKITLEQLMAIANFIQPLVLFRIHMHSSSLSHTHIHLFLVLCCSHTPMLSSGSLFYLWLEFNSTFFFYFYEVAVAYGSP